MNYCLQKLIKNLLERKYYIYISVLLTVFLTIASLITVNKELQLHVKFSDKITHAVAYCILGTSWFLSLKRNLTLFKNTLFVAFFLFIYGIVIEVLQGTFTTNREADLYDILANLVGIILALVIFNVLLRKKLCN